VFEGSGMAQSDRSATWRRVLSRVWGNVQCSMVYWQPRSRQHWSQRWTLQLQFVSTFAHCIRHFYCTIRDAKSLIVNPSDFLICFLQFLSHKSSCNSGRATRVYLSAEFRQFYHHNRDHVIHRIITLFPGRQLLSTNIFMMLPACLQCNAVHMRVVRGAGPD